MKQRLHFFWLLVVSLCSLQLAYAQKAAFRAYTAANQTTTYVYSHNVPSTIGGNPVTDSERIVDGQKAKASLLASTTRIVIDASMLDHTLPTLNSLFNGFTKVTAIEGLNNLKTTGVTGMQELFRDCQKLTNIDVTNFNTSYVTTMFAMFNDCHKLQSLNIDGWNTENVTSMENMFGNCYELNTLNTAALETDKVQSMKFMFFGCKKLPVIDVSGFNTESVTNMHAMFYQCENVTSLDVTNFNTAKVKDMSYMFRECKKLTTLDVSNFNTSEVLDMYSMFHACHKLPQVDIRSFDTRKVKRMDFMFGDCKALTSLDFTGANFKTDEVTNMKGMFRDCGNLQTPNLSNFNTVKVTDMEAMFRNCSTFVTLDVAHFNTEQVKSMKEMFKNCSTLTELNVSTFRTPEVTNMADMFNGLKQVKVLDVAQFNTAKVKDMYAMFHLCEQLRDLDLRNWNTASVTNMGFMFGGCRYLKTLDLNAFSGAALTNANGMFASTDNMEYIDIHDGQNCAEDKLTAMATSVPNTFTLKYWPQGYTTEARNLINYDGSAFTTSDYYVSDDTLTRYVDGMPNLNSNAAMKWEINIPYAFKAKQVNNTRQIAGVNNRAYTWYMPYTAPLPTNADVYEFAATTVEGIVATFVPTTDTYLEAQKPYLIVGKGSAITTSVSTEQTVKKYTPGHDVEATATSGDWKYIGTFQWRTIKQAADEGLYGLLSNFWKTYDGGTRRPQPLRAHLKNTTVVASSAPKTLAIAFDTTTGIQKMELLDANNPEQSRIYDLNGRYLGTRRDVLGSGVYVIDGQKTVVK